MASDTLLKASIFFLVFWLIFNTISFGLNYEAELNNLNDVNFEQEKEEYFNHVEGVNDSLIGGDGVTLKKSISTVKVLVTTLTFTGELGFKNIYLSFLFSFLFNIIPTLVIILLIIDIASDFFG